MQNIENFFKKLPDFAVKMFRIIFVSGVKSSNPSARLEKLCWPVMIVKLRKGQKCLILKTIANYNKILPKKRYQNLQNKIIVSRDHTLFLLQALNSFTGS